MRSALPARAPHEALLLGCLRAHHTAADDAHLRRLAREEVDWPALYRTAVTQRVHPAVGERLATACPEAVPPTVAHAFRVKTAETTARSLMLATTLVDLLRRLEAAGIPALPFKGPVLGEVAYGGFQRRACNDLDLLVRPEDFTRTEQLLVAAGYTGQHGFDGPRRALFLHLEGEYPFVHASHRLAVDLHVRIAPRRYSYAWGFEPLRERSHAVTLLGAEVPSLAPADLLHVLCWHGAKHGWRLLRCVSDVAGLIGAVPDLDWDAVRAVARQMRVERLLSLGLCLARDLLEAPLPPDVDRDLDGDPQARALAAALVSPLLADQVVPEGYFERHGFQLRMRSTLAARLRYAGSTLFFNRASRLLLGIVQPAP